MTLDRYGHLFPDEMEHLADRLNAIHAEATADRARTDEPADSSRQRKRPAR